MQALLLSDGTHATNPEEMASALNSHWAAVSKAKCIDANLFQEWLREDPEHRAGATWSRRPALSQLGAGLRLTPKCFESDQDGGTCSERSRCLGVRHQARTAFRTRHGAVLERWQ